MKFALALVFSVQAAHPDRLAQIDQIRSTPGVLWTAAANPRFEADAPGASKSLCGLKPGWKESLNASIVKGDVQMHSAKLQGTLQTESFDSVDNWPDCAEIIGEIRDQSNCGCCWAFAGAEAASDRMCIATKGQLKMPLSAQDVCFCAADDGCEGGFIQAPWMYIAESGAVSGGQYQSEDGYCADFSLPHCHHHGPQGNDPYPAEGEPGCPSASSPQCPSTCGAGAKADHADFTSDKYSFRGDVISAKGEAAIMEAIQTGGPVETAFTVYSDFENYAGGIYHHVTGDKAGGHAVKFVGWGVEDGVKYWKVANSWNPYWGEKGYFRIKRGDNECGIEDSIAASSPDANWGKVKDLPPYVAPCKDMGIVDCSAVSSCSIIAPLCLESCGCCVDDPPAFCTSSATAVV